MLCDVIFSYGFTSESFVGGVNSTPSQRNQPKYESPRNKVYNYLDVTHLYLVTDFAAGRQGMLKCMCSRGHSQMEKLHLVTHCNVPSDRGVCDIVDIAHMPRDSLYDETPPGCQVTHTRCRQFSSNEELAVKCTQICLCVVNMYFGFTRRVE